MKKNKYPMPNAAKIPVFGNVDTDYEIVLNAISTAYESLNSGCFNKTSVKEINSRFNILKMLCKRYAPNILPAVNNMHSIVLANHAGKISDAQAVNKLRSISNKYGMNPGIADEVSMRIHAAEMLKRQPKIPVVDNPLSQVFPFYFNPHQKRRKK